MADLRVPTTSADEVRRIADEVLARPEFADAQPTWWQQFLRLVGDFFSRIIEAVGGDGRGSLIGTVTVIALALLVIAVVIRYTRTVGADARRDMALQGGLGRNSTEWLADARAHEAEGRWRDAVRCRYRALLAELAAAGLVDEVAGRTSGEYLGAVQQDVPSAAASFGDATRLFEVAWYGHDTVTPDDAEAFAAAAQRTRSDAGLGRSLASAGA